ncbi:ABC transporter permease subunit [bacterium]|nr:ABC transporter permease subunit [bacterium]
MNNTLNIASYTFKKFLKTSVLYGIFFLDLLLIFLVKSIDLFNIGTQPLILIDSIVSIFEVMGVLLLLAVTANNIRGEVEKKTIYLILSKPVNKIEYLLGKILGIAYYLGIFSLITIVISIFIMNSVDPHYTGLLVLALIYKTFYLFIFIGVFLFFSIFLRPTIMIAVSLIVYYIANMNFDYIELILSNSYTKAGIGILKFIKFLLPNGDYLDLKFAAMQLTHLPFLYIVASIFYILSYLTFILLLSTWIFKKKEF